MMIPRCFLALLAMTGMSFAQTPEAPAAPATPAPKPWVSPAPTVEIWPEGKMPGKGASAPESEVVRTDGFHRLTNVSNPTLTLFPAPRKAGATDAAPAMIVCPGGGYGYTVIDKEGTEIATWLNSAGISALVLKYRTPNNRAGALQDAQRALSLARAKGSEWNVDPKRLGIIGFSAGGNLAAKTSAPLEERSYAPIDGIDEQSCRPDFAVLVYPAYLDDKAGNVAPDLNMKAHFPPLLIIHTEDDKTHVVGSKVFDAALTEAKIPHEFKLYPTGGHGYGLHCEKDAKVWPEETLEWLKKVVPGFGK